MIVRRQGNQLVLMRQTSHGALAGEFALYWGNRRFARPEPRQSVIIAAARHDDGWEEWEAAPRVNPQSQRPYQFLEMPVAVHLEIYRQGIRRVAGADPYSGLLASMHGAGLYSRFFGMHRALFAKREMSEEDCERVRRFLSEQERLQAELKRLLAPAAQDALFEQRLWVNYALLQIWDRLSLFLCMNDLGEPGLAGCLEGVPVDSLGKERVDIHVQADAAGWLALTPYPFARAPLPVRLSRRSVPDVDYPDAEALQSALAAAAQEQPVVHLTQV